MTAATSTLLGDLLSLRELLAVPERWTKGVSARDTNGELTNYSYESAVCWCLVGGCWKVATEYGPRFVALYRSLMGAMERRDSLAVWQDSPSRTHSEVLALIDKAIEAARAAHANA